MLTWLTTACTIKLQTCFREVEAVLESIALSLDSLLFLKQLLLARLMPECLGKTCPYDGKKCGAE